MPLLNLVISEIAKKKFDAVKEITNKNQHDTATLIFESMDVNAFEKAEDKT